MHHGQSVRRSRKAIWWRSISASWAGSRPKDRRFLAEILFGFITRDYLPRRAGAFRCGLCAAPRRIRRVFAQALRAIGEPIMDRTGGGNLHGAAADPAVRGDRPVRHADPAAAAAAAEDHGGGRRAWRGRSIPSSTCGRRRRRRWCANGSKRRLAPERPAWRRRRRGGDASGGWLPAFPRSLDEARRAAHMLSDMANSRRHQARPRDDRGHWRAAQARHERGSAAMPWWRPRSRLLRLR